MRGINTNILVLLVTLFTAPVFAEETPFFITDSAILSGEVTGDNRRPSSADTFKYHSCAREFKEGTVEFLRSSHGQSLKREIHLQAPMLFAEADAISLNIELDIPLLEGGAKIGQPTREDVSIHLMQRKDTGVQQNQRNRSSEVSVEDFAVSRRLGGSLRGRSAGDCRTRGREKTKSALQDSLTEINQIRQYVEESNGTTQATGSTGPSQQ